MTVSTNRIRIELTFGALTMRELANRCGVKTTAELHPLVSQMVHKTGEVIRTDGRLMLKRNQCRLAEAWK